MEDTKPSITEKEFNSIKLHSRIRSSPSHPLTIANKLIDKKIEFSNAERILPGNYIQPLEFMDCTFNDSVKISEFGSSGSVTFINCVFEKRIEIQFSNTYFEGKCIFNNELQITVSDISKLTKIENLVINGILIIIGHTKALLLQNIYSEYQQDAQEIRLISDVPSFRFDDISIKRVRISNGVEVRNLSVLNRLKVAELFIEDITSNAELQIVNSSIDILDIKGLKGNVRGITLTNSTVTHFTFVLQTLSKLTLFNCSFNNLEITGTNDTEDILNIEKVASSKLKFERVFNSGMITLKEIKISEGGLVSFMSSNMGKSDFIYCDFSNGTLEFENSKITEAFISETEFPNRVLNNGNVNHRQAQLAFGQLATAFQKQGDNVRSLEYNSREIEAHFRTIRWKSKDFFQWLNLGLNLVSNNFGRDWVRGIIFSFALGLLFFCMLLLTTDNYVFALPRIEWDLIPAYLKFMNPLRFFELEDLFKSTQKQGVIKLNYGSYIADFGGRVFVAYGYYQTIQAFRRFGRK